MGCFNVDLPGGGVAIACARSYRSMRPCSVCGRLATRLCDYKIHHQTTCDADLCANCTTRLPGGKDACPLHREECLAACRQYNLPLPA